MSDLIGFELNGAALIDKKRKFPDATGSLLLEAADEIDRLTKEVEELRGRVNSLTCTEWERPGSIRADAKPRRCVRPRFHSGHHNTLPDAQCLCADSSDGFCPVIDHAIAKETASHAEPVRSTAPTTTSAPQSGTQNPKRSEDIRPSAGAEEGADV